MTPDFWIDRLQHPDRPLADADSIAAQNERLRALGPAVRSLDALPEQVDAVQVREWIETVSCRPAAALFDGNGAPLTDSELDELQDSLALDAVPGIQPATFGLVTHRASLRTFPTMRQVFKRPGDTDLDRFQESAFFPGTPVAVVHADASGDWVFVVGEFYCAWMSAEAVAIGERGTVLDYRRREPALTVTGAQVRTLPSPSRSELSELVLDMGVRVPLCADQPEDGYAVDLPARANDRTLRIVPAQLPRTADVALAPLPYSRAVLIRQAYKFLGERYGWGHAHGARDCSGFVAEVYRSVGIELPRNSADQAASEAFDRLTFEPGTKHSARVAALKRLQAGDLVYVPGHVMMVLGQTREGPWVIHDTHSPSMKGEDGVLRPLPASGVVVTPLLPLHFGDDGGLVDAVTAIQRIRPGSAA